MLPAVKCRRFEAPGCTTGVPMGVTSWKCDRGWPNDRIRRDPLVDKEL